MKHVYENLQILILIINLTIGLSCGKALALPQDWPCFNFELKKIGVIEDSKSEFEYIYYNETSEYTININLMGNHQIPNLFANCGTAGCSGIIVDKINNKSEELRFFCENYSANYSKVNCIIGKGDEFIFKKINDKYIAHYCSNDKTKILSFDKNECNKCHCLIYENDKANKNLQTQLKMGCKFDNKTAHCFSNTGYEQWRNFEHNNDDFKNCINLLNK